jgi:hypothetical protein
LQSGATAGCNRLRSSLQSVPAQGKNGTDLPPVQDVHTRSARALSAEHQTQDQDTSCPNTSSSTRVASQMPKTTSGSGCKSIAFSSSVSNAQSGITQGLQEGRWQMTKRVMRTFASSCSVRTYPTVPD